MFNWIKTAEDRRRIAEYEAIEAAIPANFRWRGDTLAEIVASLVDARQNHTQATKALTADLARKSLECEQLKATLNEAIAKIKHPMKGRPRDAKGHFLPVNRSAHLATVGLIADPVPELDQAKRPRIPGMM